MKSGQADVPRSRRTTCRRTAAGSSGTSACRRGVSHASVDRCRRPSRDVRLDGFRAAARSRALGSVSSASSNGTEGGAYPVRRARRSARSRTASGRARSSTMAVSAIERREPVRTRQRSCGHADGGAATLRRRRRPSARERNLEGPRIADALERAQGGRARRPGRRGVDRQRAEPIDRARADHHEPRDGRFTRDLVIGSQIGEQRVDVSCGRRFDGTESEYVRPLAKSNRPRRFRVWVWSGSQSGSGSVRFEQNWSSAPSMHRNRRATVWDEGAL